MHVRNTLETLVSEMPNLTARCGLFGLCLSLYSQKELVSDFQHTYVPLIYVCTSWEIASDSQP